MPIGPLEIAIILVIVVVLFGAKRLPEMGRSLGSGMREFRDGVSGREERASAKAAREQPSALDRAPQDDPAAATARSATEPGAAHDDAETVTAEPVPERERGTSSPS